MCLTSLTPLQIVIWTGSCSVHMIGASARLQAVDESNIGCEGVGGGIAHCGRCLISMSALFFSWDEWVPETRVLKLNDASRQKQKELKNAHM